VDEKSRRRIAPPRSEDSHLNVFEEKSEEAVLLTPFDHGGFSLWRRGEEIDSGKKCEQRTVRRWCRSC
jgi:hypothetical protein